ncbi:MAG: Ni/Fe hydrogenase subunit alpha [bacterium]|nr:Ni/Fe hydrogenase subunit alpha [bacterium]
MRNVDIDVKHVTRVEGHGNIKVNVRDGSIAKLELQVVESPRYFEAFLRGRRWDEAPHLTCRICGICSVGHTTASIKGIEAACGIEPSEQTLLLRKLLLYGEQIQSHVLHVLFLAVPDFLGVGSVIPLAQTHPEVVKRALRMKRLANDICMVLAGRHIHPIAAHAGGFTHVPKPQELIDLKRRLEACRDDLAETAQVYQSLSLPDFERETDYLSLKVTGNGEYAFYDGDLVTRRHPEPLDKQHYREWVQERVVLHSAAKHCSSPFAAEYMVGALARFNNNHEQLHPAARRAAGALGLTAPCTNPFHNNTAQLVETVHCVEVGLEVIDQLLTRGLKLEPLVEPQHFGTGVGVTEVPRGILFHEYTIDDRGIISDANLIIPTGQNLANIEADMRAWVPQLLEEGLGKEEMTLKLEMLVRAYDPCISCATHFLELELV